MQGLVVFGVRVAIGHHAAAGLDVHHPVLEEGGAQDDAGVDRAIGAEVARGAGIAHPALFDLQLVDDLHRPHLGRAGERAGGQGGHHHIHRVQAVRRVALDVGDQVHDVAVAFDEEAVGDAHARRAATALDGLRGLVRAPGLEHRHTAHVVAAKVEQHQVLGALLGVGDQLGFQGRILGGRGAARPGAGDGADGDLAVPQPHQDLRRGAGQLKVAEVQVEQEGRRIGAPQAAIERERVPLERRAEAVAGHHLEDVAGADIGLGLAHDLPVALAADRRGEGVGLRLGVALQRRGRLPEVGLDRVDPRDGGVIGRPCRTRAGAHRRHQDDLLGDGVEDRDDGRPRHDAVRQVQRIGVDVGQPFDQPDHVIAHGAEQAGRRRRQAGGQVDARGGDQVPQAVERAALLRGEGAGGDGFALRDLGGVAPAAPDKVRIERDDRIPRPERAALHALEEEGVGTAVADLQVGGDRRLEVIDQPGPDELGRAGPVGLLELRKRRLDGHFASGGFPPAALAPPAGLPAAALVSVGSRPMASRAFAASIVTLIFWRAETWAVSPISRR